jgi:hypothetical protein
VDVVLLNTEAMKSYGCEFFPPAAAVPVAGRVSEPRTLAVPLTSRVAQGAPVLMPILPVAPAPVWVTIEL